MYLMNVPSDNHVPCAANCHLFVATPAASSVCWQPRLVGPYVLVAAPAQTHSRVQRPVACMQYSQPCSGGQFDFVVAEMSDEKLRTMIPKLEDEAGILQEDKTDVHNATHLILLQRAKNAIEQVLRRKYTSDIDFDNDEQVSQLLYLFFTVQDTPERDRYFISHTRDHKIEFLKSQLLSYVPKPISRPEPTSKLHEWKPLSTCTIKLFFFKYGDNNVQSLEVALSKLDQSDIMKYLVIENGDITCVTQFIDLKFDNVYKIFNIRFYSSCEFTETLRTYTFDYRYKKGQDQKITITNFFAQYGTKVGSELKCGRFKDQILQQYRACDASMPLEPTLHTREISDGDGNKVKKMMDYKF